MIKCEAEGSRNMRRIKPVSDDFLGRSTSANSCQGRVIGTGLIQTVDVGRIVKINPQNSSGGQSKDENVVGDLRGDKIGRDVELKLYSLDVEDGKRNFRIPLRGRRSGVTVGDVQRHGAVLDAQDMVLPLAHRVLWEQLWYLLSAHVEYDVHDVRNVTSFAWRAEITVFKFRAVERYHPCTKRVPRPREKLG